MPIDIGATILAYRKRKALTQEQLADKLGISSGAVSKWENGASTPDITLLKPLARVFDTTVDNLLSFQKELSDGEVAAVKLELNEIFLNDGFPAGNHKCKEYLCEYPNSNALKNVVAGLIEMHGIRWDKNAANVWDGKADKSVEKNIQYVLSLYQEIIDSGDSKYRSPALYAQARIYMISGEFDRSEAALKEIPTDNPDPLLLLSSLCIKQKEYKQAEQISKKALFSHISQAITALYTLSNLCTEDDADISRKTKYLEAMSSLQDTFGVGFNSASLSLAELFLHKGEKEQAAKWFLNYIHEIARISNSPEKGVYFSGLEEYQNTEEQKSKQAELVSAIKNDSRFNSLSGTQDYECAIKILRDL